MNPNPLSTLRRRQCLMAAALLLAGCGGVDSGGTGTGATSPTLAIGTITGFGSVIVNGVRYDDRQAVIQDDDGRTVAPDFMRLGMQAQVQASAVESVGGVATATAQAITLRSEIVGPVESVDAAAGTLVVLGQAVTIAPATALDQALASFAAGDVVEVFGTYDAAFARIVGSRIRLAGSVAAFKVRAPVVAASITGRTVKLGTATIDWSAVSLDDPARTLAIGSFVRATLDPAPVGPGRWRATALRPAGATLADRDRVEFEGRITAFRSATSFDVESVPVDASTASFPEGRTGLSLGAKVEVGGAAVGGVLVARSVKVEDESEAAALEIHGTVQSVEPDGRRFVVRGTTVTWSDATRFDTGTAADIRVGRSVELRGTLSADRTHVDASTIHVED